MKQEQKSSIAAGFLPVLLILFTCGSRDAAERAIRFEGHDQFEQDEESALRTVALQVPHLLGQPVNKADWPATVSVRPLNTESLPTQCSANLIGPRVVLTAAHCLGSGDTIAVDGTLGTCEEPGGVTACPSGPDLALCLLTADVDRTFYERIPETGEWARIGVTVRLVGRGLNTNLAAAGFRNLRQGDAEVVQPPDSTGCLAIRGQAAACSGDSGGGAFLDLGSDRRVLAGVISTHLTCASNQDIGITDLSSAASQSFVTDWAGRHPEARICGFHADAPRCHP